MKERDCLYMQKCKYVQAHTHMHMRALKHRYFHLHTTGSGELSSTEAPLYVQSQLYIPFCPTGHSVAHSAAWIPKTPQKTERGKGSETSSQLAVGG